MTDGAFFSTKVFTQASTPTGTPATRMPSVETPAPIAARSVKAGSARTALSRADRAVSRQKEVSGKKTLNFGVSDSLFQSLTHTVSMGRLCDTFGPHEGCSRKIKSENMISRRLEKNMHDSKSSTLFPSLG